MNLELNGKVALITGGSHGIGLAIATELAAEGCNIAFCARDERYSLKDAEKQIKKVGKKCIGIKMDAANEKGALFVIGSTIQEYGKIDILINNLGGGSSWGDQNEWLATPLEKWHQVFELNYLSTVSFTNEVVPLMMKHGYGRIISIGSIFGKESGGMPWFQAAKSAQLSFMKSMSSKKEYVSRGITFNTVCPGLVDMPDKQIHEKEKELTKKIPLGRFGNTQDISPIVAFLCSKKASFINGSCIVVDGGQTNSF